MIWIALSFLAMIALMLLAIHTPRIELCVVGLAAFSAFTAVVLYRLGATTAAVVELSVGAGLVAVLFAFANAVLEHVPTGQHAPLPRRLAVALVVPLIAISAGVVALTFDPVAQPLQGGTFQVVFWEDRRADVLVQLVLIFTTVIGVLSLLPTITMQGTTSLHEDASNTITLPDEQPEALPDFEDVPVVAALSDDPETLEPTHATLEGRHP